MFRLHASGSEHLWDVPFEGRLRASRVVGEAVVLVNEQGRVFRAKLEG